MVHRSGAGRVRGWLATWVAGVLALGACGPRPASTIGNTGAAPAPDAGATASATPDAAVDPDADMDRDGVPDAIDQCPQEPMVMSAGCTPEKMRGCPDDCRW